MDIEKAKNILNHYLEMEEFDSAEDFLIAIDVVLSELEKKEAIINEMAKHIHLSGDYECLNKECEDDGDISCEDCIKEYFYKKVKETKDNDIQFFKNTKITKYCRRKLNRRSARNSKRNSF